MMGRIVVMVCSSEDAIPLKGRTVDVVEATEALENRSQNGRKTQSQEPIARVTHTRVAGLEINDLQMCVRHGEYPAMAVEWMRWSLKATSDSKENVKREQISGLNEAGVSPLFNPVWFRYVVFSGSVLFPRTHDAESPIPTLIN